MQTILRKLCSFGICACLLVGSSLAGAETVTLAWDPNPPEENVAG